MFDTPAPASGYATTVTLITGLAWPLVAGAVVVVYRRELRKLFQILTERLASAQSFKVGPVEIGGIFEAAEQRTKAALSSTSTAPSGIPAEQVESSHKLEEQLDTSGVSLSERLPAARERLTKLASNYDSLRVEAPSGEYRTRPDADICPAGGSAPATTLRIVQRGRAAGRHCHSAGALRCELHSMAAQSLRRRKPGVPSLQRGACAQENGRMPNAKGQPELAAAIAFALDRVSSFTGGPPDANTVDVLEDARAFLN